MISRDIEFLSSTGCISSKKRFCSDVAGMSVVEISCDTIDVIACRSEGCDNIYVYNCGP